MVWGSSFSGGHVVPVAVADGRVAAAIAQTPAMDGIVTLLTRRAYGRARRMLARLVLAGLARPRRLAARAPAR